MKKLGCAKCGGAMKKMKLGGKVSTLAKVGVMNENMGTSSQYQPVAKKGGSVKKAKLAAMAPPKGKITRADIITAAKRNARKK